MWKSTTLGVVNGGTTTSRPTLVIAKSGDGWTVTDGLSRTFTCRETDDGLKTVAGPSGPVKDGDVFRREGDELVMFNGGDEWMRFAKE